MGIYILLRGLNALHSSQVNGGSAATLDTVNGESLTASPAGGGALLFRGRQSAATTVRTDLKTCNSVVDFINQVEKSFVCCHQILPMASWYVLCTCDRVHSPEGHDHMCRY
jgi:hypothetical protein